MNEAGVFESSGAEVNSPGSDPTNTFYEKSSDFTYLGLAAAPAAWCNWKNTKLGLVG